jgi:hypothetical protein
MDKKTAGIIAVVATSIICGFPGLAGLCLGALVLIGNFLPDSSVDPADMNLVTGSGIFIICLSLVFITIPIIIVYFTMVKKTKESMGFDGPIPEDDF